MTEYHFNVELAQRHGVNGAIFLHAMAFWIAKNQANGRHFHKGRTWTYNSLEALTQSSANALEYAEMAKNAPTDSGRMALTVLVVLPVMLAYPFFQKYFVKGLTVGGVKG